jgi:hypothetical protein
VAASQELAKVAGLVLDGRLIGEDHAEVNLAEQLQMAEKGFAESKDDGTLAERDVEPEWPALRSQWPQATPGQPAPAAVCALALVAPAGEAQYVAFTPAAPATPR